MKDIVKAVIESGAYELADMLAKVDTLWVEGALTDQERDELRAMAQDNADPERSMPPLLARVEALELRVKALEQEGGGDGPDPGVQEWRQPTGAHDAYAKGDRVSYKGKVWESTVDGNVWAPDVYPQGWREV